MIRTGRQELRTWPLSPCARVASASRRHHRPRWLMIEHPFCGQPHRRRWTAPCRGVDGGPSGVDDRPAGVERLPAARGQGGQVHLRTLGTTCCDPIAHRTTTSCVFRLDPASTTAYSLKVAPTPDDHPEPARTVILEATVGTGEDRRWNDPTDDPAATCHPHPVTARPSNGRSLRPQSPTRLAPGSRVCPLGSRSGPPANW
jgi:hypothetical protein